VREPSPGKRLTVNLEKIKIIALAPKTVLQNPICQECGKRLESMGKDKGFRCKKCGARFKDAKKARSAVERELQVGLHVTSTRSQRHLTKPLRRYGLEKHGSPSAGMIESWHSS
jgi:tRNA(Ile2)-agmatinylcytidine synthase